MTSRDPLDKALENAQGVLHAARRMAKTSGGYFAGSYKVRQIDEAIDAIQKVRDR